MTRVRTGTRLIDRIACFRRTVLVAKGDKQYSLGCSRFGGTLGKNGTKRSLKASNIPVRRFVAFSDGSIERDLYLGFHSLRSLHPRL